MGEALIYVVAKAPLAGAVKTRLCPPLHPQQAADLYEGMLLDSLAVAAAVPGAGVRAICPDEAHRASLRRLVPASCEVVAQRAPGLGAALEESFRDGLAQAEAVAVISSDNPTLPAERLCRAFRALGEHDVVFGPSDDGGYYLVAARATHATLFRDMTWSTSGVLAESLRRCASIGLRPHLLERWYDVDDGAGLALLLADLARTTREQAVHTRRALASLELDVRDNWASATTPRRGCHPERLSS